MLFDHNDLLWAAGWVAAALAVLLVVRAVVYELVVR